VLLQLAQQNAEQGVSIINAKETKKMPKTILVTGATDGIRLETAKLLVPLGHHVLLHGRNRSKLKEVQKTLSDLPDGGGIES
jgi:NADP-dependent 3-hydroxy acid dehydrogenase YdfG